MRALVTGGAGFIGSNLVDKLIEKGWGVIVLDDLSTGKKENINTNAKFYNVDISTMTDLGRTNKNVFRLFEGIDIVFHLAAKARVQPSIVDPVSFNKVNVQGTLNVLLASHNAGVKRVVYSASSSAYGNATKFPTPEEHSTNPLSPYGLQKYIGEQYCKMFSQVYGLDTVSLRYFNIYGERMNLDGAYCLVLGIFAQQMLNEKDLTITNDGKQRRDFTYVGDAVEANILAATQKDKFNGDVFNIGNGKNYSVNEVADMLGGNKTYGKTVKEPFQTLADNSKANLMLDWQPKGDLPTWIKKYKMDLGI
jgi:UDP-glucose 4-epimerase|tara:strand:- start:1 stop:921 length:921 start_codon:yes stop_codon:yes gene_type:complete